MSALVFILIAVLALAAAYVCGIAPCLRRPDDRALRGWYYAHRGLHDGNHAVPENSMEAFRRAVEGGYGIELDVQLTKDGRLIVHHDASTKRVCGVDKNIRQCTYEELCAVPLPDGSRIPLLSEVLELVGGRVPLIVEIKYHGGAKDNAAAAYEHFKAYQGPFCVESFDPRAVRWFKDHAPQILRGQLASGAKWNGKDSSLATHLLLKTLLANAISRPHFVAYSFPQDGTLGMWLMKHVLRPRLAAWTIRDQKTLDAAIGAGYHYPIFELFIPEQKN